MTSNHKKILDYKELSSYLVFGVGATLINIIAFYVFSDVLGVDYLISNVIAWILAFIFAFITNKLWVFNSKSLAKEKMVPEFIGFFGFRAFTGILDMAMMFIFVSLLLFPGLFSKIVVNIVVIVINYVASKFIIFNDKEVI